MDQSKVFVCIRLLLLFVSARYSWYYTPTRRRETQHTVEAIYVYYDAYI